MDHCVRVHCMLRCMTFGSMWYPMSLNPVCTCVCSYSQSMYIYLVVTCTTCTMSHQCSSCLFPLPSCMHVCTGCDLLSAYSSCSMQGGVNAFLLCATGGHLPVAKYLSPKMEGHLFDSDDDGNTALHWAAKFGQLPMVEYLVRSCGFDVKARDKVGVHLCCLSDAFCILWPLWEIFLGVVST